MMHARAHSRVAEAGGLTVLGDECVVDVVAVVEHARYVRDVEFRVESFEGCADFGPIASAIPKMTRYTIRTALPPTVRWSCCP